MVSQKMESANFLKKYISPCLSVLTRYTDKISFPWHKMMINSERSKLLDKVLFHNHLNYADRIRKKAITSIINLDKGQLKKTTILKKSVKALNSTFYPFKITNLHIMASTYNIIISICITFSQINRYSTLIIAGGFIHRVAWCSDLIWDRSANLYINYPIIFGGY